MKSSWYRLLLGAAFFGVTCVAAVTGYMLAGWEFLDAIYMVVITVFGVGYGETKPLSDPALKIFTMCVIIAGCSSGIYFVGGFVQMVAEGEINRALGNRRMSKGIEKLSQHAIICGYGRVGQMLVANLAEHGHPLVVIDNSESRANEARAAGFPAVLGSASEESTLEAAGIDRAKVLATVLPDDTANVFITLTARDLNPTIEIIARAESPSTEKKLLRSGATRIVMPALIGATKIAHHIVRPSAEEVLVGLTGTGHLNDELGAIGLELSEIEIQPGSSLVARTVGEIETSGTGGFVVVALRHPDLSVVRNPSARESLAAGDVLILLGHSQNMPQLAVKAKPAIVTSYRGTKV